MEFIYGFIVIFILYVYKFKDDLNKEKADTLLGGLALILGVVLVINIILLIF